MYIIYFKLFYYTFITLYNTSTLVYVRLLDIAIDVLYILYIQADIVNFQTLNYIKFLRSDRKFMSVKKNVVKS